MDMVRVRCLFDRRDLEEKIGRPKGQKGLETVTERP